MSDTQILTKHPSWGVNGSKLGTFGFSLPVTDDLVSIPFNSDHQSVLASFGLKFEGDFGENNTLHVHPGQKPHDLTLRLRGCSNVAVILGLGNPITGRLAFNGRGGLFVAGGFGFMGGTSSFRVTMAEGAAVFFGRDCTSVRSEWLVEGSGRSLIVGDDMMSSWDVIVRNYDSHAIIDTVSKRVINRPGDTIIGPHCWLGLGSNILRGVTIGRSTIIGAHASVLANVPDNCAVAGAPGRVTRENVTWTRAPSPSDTMIENTIAAWCR